MDDELIDEREVARAQRRSVAAVRNDRLRHKGVPFVKIGRSVRYRRSDLQKYIASLPAQFSTADEGHDASKSNEHRNG